MTMLQVISYYFIERYVKSKLKKSVVLPAVAYNPVAPEAVLK